MTQILFLILFIPLCLLTAAVIWLFIEVKAMQKSTHQVAYVDPWKDLMKEQGEEDDFPQQFETLSEEEEKKLRKDPFEDQNIN